jgi:hypothetical protein
LTTLFNNGSDYKFPLSPATIRIGKALLKDLKSNVADSYTLSKLHALVYPCFSVRQSTGEYSKWNDTLECFMALHALKADGNFENGGDLTQFFANLKYLTRSIQLYEAVKNLEAFDNDIIMCV